MAAGVAAVIRIDAVWLAVEPIDMRAGADRLLARVVHVFGAAKSHHGYLFANARGTRIKLLVHDGFGIWCAARRLNQGRFVWPRQEDAANKVERQVRKSAAALVVARRVGERFDAVVTGASPKGTFVRVANPPIEGKLVEGERGLDVGDFVSVQLSSVNVDRGFIDFVRPQSIVAM